MDQKELLSIARTAEKNAYAPYSKILVGAALLAADHTIYTGCNIENASYGAANCAERTAIFKAISEGKRTFQAIAVTSSLEEFPYPCGICRQVLAEFMPDGIVVLANRNNQIIEIPVAKLLPHAFQLPKEESDN